MQLGFTSAMQTCTQDATPELAKQTGRQRAPGKVRLRLDLIQRVPCYTTQPTRISRQNHTGLKGQPPYRVRRQCCGCKHDSAMIDLPNICNHSATAMQTSATATNKCVQSTEVEAMRFRAMQSQPRCNPKQCNPSNAIQAMQYASVNSPPCNANEGNCSTFQATQFKAVQFKRCSRRRGAIQSTAVKTMQYTSVAIPTRSNPKRCNPKAMLPRVLQTQSNANAIKAMQCERVQLQHAKAMFRAKCNPKTTQADLFL